MAADAHLVETAIGSELLFDGHFLRLRRDTVALPDGAQATREFVVHPGAVAVVPLLDDGRLLLERQYRHPLGRVIVELPAGKIDAGEVALDCAARELREETGHEAAEWAFAGCIHNAAAYSTEAIEIWFARGLRAGPQRLDDGEFIELVRWSEVELDAAVLAGDVTDAKTLAGLWWLQRWRAGAWQPEWRQADRMSP